MRDGERAMQPTFQPEDVVYQEHFASGHSTKNLLTRFGGARLCLRLVVTKEWLWITSWPVMSLITACYDLEHVIPLGSIQSIRRSAFGGVRLTFRNSRNEERTLVLYSWNAQKFIQSLAVRSDIEADS